MSDKGEKTPLLKSTTLVPPRRQKRGVSHSEMVVKGNSPVDSHMTAAGPDVDTFGCSEVSVPLGDPTKSSGYRFSSSSCHKNAEEGLSKISHFRTHSPGFVDSLVLNQDPSDFIFVGENDDEDSEEAPFKVNDASKRSSDARADRLTQGMPDEVLQRIYSYLDASTIEQTSKVCRRLLSVVSQKSTWQASSKLWSTSTQKKFSSATSLMEILACYWQEVDFQRMERRIQLRRQREDRKIVWRDRTDALLRILFFNRSVDFLTVLSFILGTIYMALRSQELILWDWRIVLIPFYIPLLLLIVIPIAYHLYDYIFFASYFRRITFGKVFWYWFFINDENSHPYRLLYYSFMFNLALFFSLLMFILNPKSLLPAWSLAFPFSLFALAVTSELIFGWSSGKNWNSTRHKGDSVFLIILSILPALASITVTLKIDQIIHWSWVASFLPIWAFIAHAWLFHLMTFLLSEATQIFPRNCSFIGGLDGYVLLACYPIYTIVIIVPILAVFVLISLNLDGITHIDWPIVFIPVFFHDIILLTLCSLADCVVLNQIED